MKEKTFEEREQEIINSTWFSEGAKHRALEKLRYSKDVPRVELPELAELFKEVMEKYGYKYYSLDCFSLRYLDTKLTYQIT